MSLSSAYLACKPRLISDAKDAAFLSDRDQSGNGSCWIYAGVQTINANAMLETYTKDLGLPFHNASTKEQVLEVEKWVSDKSLSEKILAHQHLHQLPLLSINGMVAYIHLAEYKEWLEAGRLNHFEMISGSSIKLESYLTKRLITTTEVPDRFDPSLKDYSTLIKQDCQAPLCNLQSIHEVINHLKPFTKPARDHAMAINEIISRPYRIPNKWWAVARNDRIVLPFAEPTSPDSNQRAREELYLPPQASSAAEWIAGNPLVGRRNTLRKGFWPIWQEYGDGKSEPEILFMAELLAIWSKLGMSTSVSVYDFDIVGDEFVSGTFSAHAMALEGPYKAKDNFGLKFRNSWLGQSVLRLTDFENVAWSIEMPNYRWQQFLRPVAAARDGECQRFRYSTDSGLYFATLNVLLKEGVLNFNQLSESHKSFFKFASGCFGM